MEKHTKLKQNVDRMMARLEGQPITDPLVKMVLDEVSELYGSVPNPDFDIYYLYSPVEFKYRDHFSPEIFYRDFAAVAAQICKRLGVDSMRSWLLNEMQRKGIQSELIPEEITCLLFGGLVKPPAPFFIGIQLATLDYPEDEWADTESSLTAEFSANFSQVYEYGDPDYVKQLFSQIEELPERENGPQLGKWIRAAMFKRILDRTFPNLFYRWITRCHRPQLDPYWQFSENAFLAS